MSRRAFTLIELLVVIAIIGLLVTILLPSLKSARDLARNAVCQANLSTLGRADQMYTNNHRDMLFPGGYKVNVGADTPPEAERMWPAILVANKLVSAPTSDDLDTLAEGGSPFQCPNGLEDVKPWGWSHQDYPNTAWATRTLDDDGKWLHCWYGANGEDWEQYAFPHPSFERADGSRKYIHRASSIAGVALAEVPSLQEGAGLHQHQRRMVDSRHGRDGLNFNAVFLDGHVSALHWMLHVPQGGGQTYRWRNNDLASPEITWPISSDRDFGRVD